MNCFPFAFSAGVAVVLQNSLNGLMTPWLGAVGTAMIGFIVQLLSVIVYQLVTEHHLISLKPIPLLYYSTGLIAVFIVGMNGICVSKMGSAVTTSCSVAGQLIMSAVTDHFGLFKTEQHLFEKKRIPAFILILFGVLAMNLIGESGGKVPLHLLLLGVFLGACSVLVRTVNYLTSECTGSAFGGGFVNSFSGAIAGILLYLISTGFHPDFSVYSQIPAACYAAGLFGTICLLCNIRAYKAQNVFYATIFMLVGQIVTGILIDIFLFHSLSIGKVVGIIIVLAGVFLDKLITRNRSE